MVPGPRLLGLALHAGRHRFLLQELTSIAKLVSSAAERAPRSCSTVRLEFDKSFITRGQHTASEVAEQSVPPVPPGPSQNGIVPESQLTPRETEAGSIEESKQVNRAQEKLQAAAKDSFLKSITASSGPAAFYKENRLSGAYKKDARQELTVTKLQRLFDELKAIYKSRRKSGLTVVDHAGSSRSQGGWWSGFSSFLGESKPKEAEPAKPKGLYMYGGVGTGKTMLMDLLVHSAPPQFKLQRTHFHDFMLKIHSLLREYRAQADPLLQVADRVASGTNVLCLDELFVTDVADAAILNRLFGRLWQLGVVLVATSNRHPDDLYKGGLQRELFLPFIAKLKEQTEVHDMHSAIDYRKLAKHKKGLSFTPEDSSDPNKELVEHFEEIAQSQGGKPEARTIAVQMGRKLEVPLARGELCLVTFNELCKKNLGAADYIALAHTFHTVALQGVPIFVASLKSEAYRFVTLIDVFYENRIQVMCSAAGSPMDIFQNVFSQQDAKKQGPHVTQDDLIIDDNLAFSKDRTISRLTEMGTTEYLMEHARRHAPCHVLALDERPKDATSRTSDQQVAMAA